MFSYFTRNGDTKGAQTLFISIDGKLWEKSYWIDIDNFTINLCTWTQKEGH